MKAEAWLFVVCSVFFVLVAPAYWLITEDPTGTSALVMIFWVGIYPKPFLDVAGPSVESLWTSIQHVSLPGTIK